MDAPGAVDLALVTRVASPPVGDEWVHEVKFDGYRMLSRFDGHGDVRLITRNGNEWTSRAPGVVNALRALGLRDTVIDGEAALFHADGRPDFHGLRGRTRAGQITYLAFDVLCVSGHDVRSATLLERRRELAQLFPKPGQNAWLHVSEVFEGSGPQFFEAVCRLGVEGMVSKRRARPYPRGRTREWLKTLNPAYRRV